METTKAGEEINESERRAHSWRQPVLRVVGKEAQADSRDAREFALPRFTAREVAVAASNSISSSL